MAAFVKLQANRGAVTIDGCDLSLVEEFRWWMKPSGNTAYAFTRLRDRSGKVRWVHMHRLILDVVDDHAVTVDHINGNGLDNRRGNLRKSDRFGNAQNSRSKGNSTTGLRGVDRMGESRYRASIMARGVKHQLGQFDTAEDAAAAYEAAARQLHGAFAECNRPGGKS